jgi:hypothetical protein
MTQHLRPLGVVREVINTVGHEITYAYDDLVFVDHNAYLLQFGNNSRHIGLFFNMEFPDEDAAALADQIVGAGAEKGLVIERMGHFELYPKPGDNLEIRFFRNKGVLSDTEAKSG